MVATIDSIEMPALPTAVEAHPMKGGDDSHSYSQNSCYQVPQFPTSTFLFFNFFVYSDN